MGANSMFPELFRKFIRFGNVGHPLMTNSQFQPKMTELYTIEPIAIIEVNIIWCVVDILKTYSSFQTTLTELYTIETNFYI